MSFEFPYRLRKSDHTTLAYPEVNLELKTSFGKLTYQFIFDSGADMTTIPEYMMHVLGISKDNAIQTRSYGISEEAIPSWEATIPVKLGTISFDLPITFIPNKDVPFLLGKEGIFSRFNILLDNDNQKTVFRVR